MSNISRAFPVFAIAFAIIYIASVEYNWALFTYQPRFGTWGALVQAPIPPGPAMYWYGWLATATIGAAVIAMISLVLPRTLDRLWSVLVWVVPVFMICLQLFLLRGYFIR
jgi:hypothetical protein